MPPASAKDLGPAAKREGDDGELPAGAVGRLGMSRFRFEGEAGGRIAFSPDGKLLACGSSIGMIVFEVATGPRVQVFPQSGRPLRFLADGRRLAVGDMGSNGTKVIFCALGEEKPTTALHLPEKRALVVDVTADGSRALLVDNLQKAYMWDMKAGRELWSCGKPNFGSVLPLSADGKSFVMFENGAELRSVATGEVISKFPGRRTTADGCCLCPDGRLAVANAPQKGVAILTAGDVPSIRTFTSDWLHRECRVRPIPDTWSASPYLALRSGTRPRPRVPSRWFVCQPRDMPGFLRTAKSSCWPTSGTSPCIRSGTGNCCRSQPTHRQPCFACADRRW